ncbi:hypothetical protein A9Q81_14265 [Gammaproteobacteria bacterium 42_54_T18]|nr:hypothetical protein A9Q81_14265 [Gammaproteobacteria bacterium 42_54_T18]
MRYVSRRVIFNVLRDIVLLSFGLFFSQQVSAELAQNLSIGNPKALALGNAVTADPPGIDSIHFNPAGLTRLKGRLQETKLLIADVSIIGEFRSNEEFDAFQEQTGIYDPVANTESELSSAAAYLPFYGFTELPVAGGVLGGASVSSKDSNMTFATAVYMPFAMGMVREDDDPGRHAGRKMAATRLTYFSPSMGLKVTENFSVGVSVGFSYVGIALDLDFRLANTAITSLASGLNDICATNGDTFGEVCGEKFNTYSTLIRMEGEFEKPLSLTMNVGFLWDVTPWFTWGLVWQSSASDELEGDLRLTFSDEVWNVVQSLGEFGVGMDSRTLEYKASQEMLLAQHISTGISVRVLPDLKVNFDVKWTETSIIETNTVTMEEDDEMLALLGTFIEGISANEIVFPAGYEDTWNWGLGVEYDYSDTLALRFGYEPRRSGIPEDKRDFMTPFGDMTLYSVGFSYKMDVTSVFDVALGYGKSVQDIPTGSSTNGNDNRQDNIIYNPYAGLDVHTELTMVMLEMSYRSEF